MPHADASFLPPDIISKNDFWDHVYEQLVNLLSSQRSWISNCANASSLVYTSLLAFETHFGSEEKAVNWCGFYIDSSLFPTPSLSSVNKDDPAKEEKNLLLGSWGLCRRLHSGKHSTRSRC
ncbi:hypothetical protein PNOK_0528300 [Pyrrhoderma noxium]|uniref:Uncharacterized protein n=1 Tax=Pyrrhoderma noxium TaxID=2282107 RepID=A0A286UFR1_9AGAM|nr:hypothetical protein PNOK_0528300 [Pyrrhoderma noxium]